MISNQITDKVLRLVFLSFEIYKFLVINEFGFKKFEFMCVLKTKCLVAIVAFSQFSTVIYINDVKIPQQWQAKPRAD